MSTQFYIGRYGLDFIDDFYPDGLPREWRFDYYANVFQTLLLPLDSNEDIESISEELDEDFHLVFEVTEDVNLAPLKEIVEQVGQQQNIIFWFAIKQKPSQKILNLLSGYALVFECEQPIKALLDDYHYYRFNNKHIYYNHYPMIVSSLSLSDEEIRGFLEKIATTKQKTIIICRSAESASLEKAKTIAQMLGY